MGSCRRVGLAGAGLLAELADHPADQRLVNLYGEPKAWAGKSILNVAASGKFSCDRTIAEHVAGRRQGLAANPSTAANLRWLVSKVRNSIAPRCRAVAI